MADAERSQPVPILLGFVLIASVLWFSDWLVLTGEGTYVEGLEREPTITVEYTVDASQEILTVSLRNATPLLEYWNNREVISNSDSGEGQSTDETPSGGSDEKGGTSNLDSTRIFILLTLVLTALMLSETVRKQSWIWGRATLAVWLLLGFMLVISVPMSAASDFGFSDDGESSTGGFDSAGESEVSNDQFAHFESESDVKISLIDAPRFEYSSGGFDLGLLAEEDRQGVIDDPPEKGEAGHEAYIGFEGELSAIPGKAAIWWLVLGILIVYATNINKIIEKTATDSLSESI